MSKDRKASREELRQQLDEELSSHSPFALITLAEWQRRERRHRMPLGIGVILLMGVFFIPSLFLIGLITDENWRAAAAFPLMFAAIGAWMWSLSLLSRRFGLCCPYCHTAFAFNHNRSKFERIRPYDDLGRCPRCQRMIFTDWTKEEGWAETDPAAIQRKRSTPQWYSLSTWIASGIIGFFAAFIFWRPYIPLAIYKLGAEDLVFHFAPVTALLIWGLILSIRSFVLKEGRYLIWTAVRYAVIVFGICVVTFIVIAYRMNPNGGLDKFAEQIRQTADLSSIRTWAEGYQPSKSDARTRSGDAVFVQADRWPDCIRALGPTKVLYVLAEKRMTLIFVGRYWFWTFTVAPSGTKPENVNGKSVQLSDGIWVEE